MKDFAHDVALIVGKHNPKALRLGDMYELLLEQKERTKLLKVPYRAHSLTKVMAKLHSKRLIYAATISMQMRAMNKIEFDHTTQKLVDMAYPVVKS